MLHELAHNQIPLVCMFLPHHSASTFFVFGMCSTSHFFLFHFLSESSAMNKQYSHDSGNTIFLLSLSLLSEQDGDLPLLNSPLEMPQHDPMLSGSVAAPEEDLLMYLNNPNLFLDSDNLQEEPGLPEFSLQVFNCLAPQSCGSIFQ